MKLPVLFLGHGSPMNAIGRSPYAEEWHNMGEDLRDEFDDEIQSILCISAHWLTNGTRVTAMEEPRTLHDFAGFPRELFNVRYPVEGNPALAKRIQGLLGDTVQLDYDWGLDHGAWSVLRHMFPDADIPVVQMSLDRNLNARQHFELAKQLAPLRQEGVLIVGSGNIVHNTQLCDWQNPAATGQAYTWAELTHELVNKWIKARRYDNLLDEKNYSRAMKMAIPTYEHFWPLLYALALRGEREAIEFFNEEIVGKSISMTSLVSGFV